MIVNELNSRHHHEQNQGQFQQLGVEQSSILLNTFKISLKISFTFGTSSLNAVYTSLSLCNLSSSIVSLKSVHRFVSTQHQLLLVAAIPQCIEAQVLLTTILLFAHPLDKANKVIGPRITGLPLIPSFSFASLNNVKGRFSVNTGLASSSSGTI